jgi:hypothetical protein
MKTKREDEEEEEKVDAGGGGEGGGIGLLWGCGGYLHIILCLAKRSRRNVTGGCHQTV